MENIVEETISNSDQKKVSIYVGNVPWKATKEEISTLISTKAAVEVSDVRIISERETGRSRGFAFVDIIAKSEDDFIDNAPEMELNGRTLIFKHANERNNDKREDSSEPTTSPSIY